MWRLLTINKLFKFYKIMNILKKFWHSIATQFIPLKLCASLKQTYCYYYYLCLKDFIKKLLKPKKMIAIKWRTNTNEDFQYITYLEEDTFKKCRGPILLENFINPQKFEFKVEKSITTEYVDVINNDSIEIIYKPNSNFYYIENGILYIGEHNKETLIKENFKQFRIDNADWVDISKITYNTDCFIDFNSNLFIPSTEKNKQLISICEDPTKYIQKPYSDFVSIFRLIK